jgi:hypothetical protein
MAGRPFIHEEGLIRSWERFLTGDPHVRWSAMWLFVVLEHWLETHAL